MARAHHLKPRLFRVFDEPPRVPQKNGFRVPCKFFSLSSYLFRNNLMQPLRSL